MVDDPLKKILTNIGEFQRKSNPDYEVRFNWDRELDAKLSPYQVKLMDMAIASAYAWHSVFDPAQPTSSVDFFVEEIITDTLIGPGASGSEAQIIIAYLKSIELITPFGDELMLNVTALDEVGTIWQLWDAHQANVDMIEKVSGDRLSHEKYNLLQVPDQFRLPQFRGNDDQDFQVGPFTQRRPDS